MENENGRQQKLRANPSKQLMVPMQVFPRGAPAKREVCDLNHRNGE